ncbi:NAD(P)H-binding protein [Jiangella asiatica]|uniref:NmrA family transcriptional regulator n=1 Tax=Jiangella asiatica TaxID=2530372 RepID=A0A4R5D6K4_9ACTN|nr:NAD(P)H-binding protein [Jiangella asiatica]TDE09099.1 NmrA family transcriptional regulator [Jiangella asiatica]
MTESPVLVLGATGSTGRRVAGLLRARGVPVRAAARTGEVRFDWTEPRTWEPAVGGADRMYLMAPHELPVDPAFVTVAVGAGVRRIVLLSSRGIEAMGDQRLLDAERTVRDSGAEWTIVRADWFDQNFDEGFFRPAVMAGELAIPLDDHRQGFVDADDIAAVAVTALTEDGHAGRGYEVTGPEALSFGAATDLVGQAAGRSVQYRGSAEEYLVAQAALGVPRAEAEQAVAAFAALRAQGDPELSDAVRQVTGRAPKRFATYAAEAAARGAWRG